MQQGGYSAPAKVQENRPGRFRNTREKLPDGPETDRLRLERRLVRCLAADYDTAMAAMEQMPEGFFEVAAHERFAEELLCAYAQTKEPSISALLAGLDPEDAEQVASALAAAPPEEQLSPQEARACIRTMQDWSLRKQIQRLSIAAQREDALPEQRRELLARIQKLTEKLHSSTM